MKIFLIVSTTEEHRPVKTGHAPYPKKPCQTIDTRAGYPLPMNNDKASKTRDNLFVIEHSHHNPLKIDEFPFFCKVRHQVSHCRRIRRRRRNRNNHMQRMKSFMCPDFSIRMRQGGVRRSLTIASQNSRSRDQTAGFVC
jgi:hypothetical protein